MTQNELKYRYFTYGIITAFIISAISFMLWVVI